MGLVTVNVYVDGEECTSHKHHRRHRLHLKKIGPFSEQILNVPDRTEEHVVVELRDTQQVSAEFGAPTDKKGKTTTIQDGSAVWTSDNEDAVTVVPDASNPLKALLVAGNPGAAQVSLSADADLGDGVVTITSDPIGVSVVVGQATAFGAATLGTPEEQP